MAMMKERVLQGSPFKDWHSADLIEEKRVALLDVLNAQNALRDNILHLDEHRKTFAHHPANQTRH